MPRMSFATNRLMLLVERLGLRVSNSDAVSLTSCLFIQLWQGSNSCYVLLPLLNTPRPNYLILSYAVTLGRFIPYHTTFSLSFVSLGFVVYFSW